MNLHALLEQRRARGRPVGVGLIGAGKFGAMYLAQVPRIPGVHLIGIADQSVKNAQTNLERVGWERSRYAAASLDAAHREGSPHLSDDWERLVTHPAVEVIVEATGNPPAAVKHIL